MFVERLVLLVIAVNFVDGTHRSILVGKKLFFTLTDLVFPVDVIEISDKSRGGSVKCPGHVPTRCPRGTDLWGVSTGASRSSGVRNRDRTGGSHRYSSWCSGGFHSSGGGNVVCRSEWSFFV